jgi:hypothetical protein
MDELSMNLDGSLMDCKDDLSYENVPMVKLERPVLEKEPKVSAIEQELKKEKNSKTLAENCGGLRQEWYDKSKKGELGSSGLPVYADHMLESNATQDEEMANFCKLAKVHYVTLRERENMEKKIRSEICTLCSICDSVIYRLNDLLKNMDKPYEEKEEIPEIPDEMIALSGVHKKMKLRR